MPCRRLIARYKRAITQEVARLHIAMTVDSHTAVLNAFEHPIDAVTIFRSSTAEVTRKFPVSLQVSTID